MRVGQIVPSLEQRHGGPSRSVRALANGLARAGHAVELLTTLEPGRQMESRDPDACTLHVFPRQFPLSLCRSTPLRQHLDAADYECIHHHSLWLLTLRYAADFARRRSTPLVISPRGMMTDWAWQHRRWRKRLAEQLIHPGAFQIARGWHATSAEEANDIRARGFQQPICVAPNGVDIPADAQLDRDRTWWLTQFPVLANRRVALFYSRFHQKKRVRELIDLWTAQPRGDWLLLIVGVPEEYSVAEIQGWIANKNASGSILVRDGAGVPSPYGVADLFVLPSHSENFGLVIAESLAARVPVLVTDTTPWRTAETVGAGWCVSWAEYPQTLARVLQEPTSALRERGIAARAWAAKNFSWSSVAEQLGDFYRSLR